MLVANRAQCRGDQRLRLAALENRAAVRSRQDADLTLDVANIVGPAAVRALARFQNHVRHYLPLDLMHDAPCFAAIEFGAFGVLRSDVIQDFRVQIRDGLVAFLLPDDLLPFAELLEAAILQQAAQLFVSGRRFPGHRLAGFFSQLALHLAGDADRFMSQLDRFENVLLADLAPAKLDHVHLVGMAAEHEFHVAVFQLRDRRVDHQLPIDPPDAHRADRLANGHPADGQRRRRPDHAQQIGIVLLIVRQHHGLDQDFVLEIFVEQRPNRPIDHPHGQDFFVRRAAFTLEEAAGNLARRVRLLAIIDRQWKEINTGPRRARDHAHKNRRLAILQPHGTGRLPRNPAGLHRHHPACNFSFNFHMCHNFEPTFFLLTTFQHVITFQH